MRKTILTIFGVICLGVGIVFIIVNFVLIPKNYSRYVEKYSSEYNLDTALVYAIIKAESDFDKGAVSSSGALGLMQLMPSTAEWIANEFGETFYKNLLFDPETNIKYGSFYLRYLLNKFDDINAVICAYNAGESIVRNWFDENGDFDENKITYEETKNYLKKVNTFYLFYKN